MSGVHKDIGKMDAQGLHQTETDKKRVVHAQTILGKYGAEWSIGQYANCQCDLSVLRNIIDPKSNF